jgi:pilus assembly protein Flp/PilA
MSLRHRTRVSGDEGASAVEYGLILAAIAAVIVAVVFGLGLVTQTLFSETSSCLSAEDGATC